MYIDDQTGALIEARVLVACARQHQIDVQGLLGPAERADPPRPTGSGHEIREPCAIRGRQPQHHHHQAERRRAHLLHRIVRSARSTAGSRSPFMRLMRRTTYAASVAPAPARRSWVSASPITSVRRQPPRPGRESPGSHARLGTGLSSAPPQSSDSPTNMIQRVDASAAQKHHRSFANRVAVPGSRPLARHDAARAAHALAWPHAHRAGAAAPTSEVVLQLWPAAAGSLKRS